MKKQVAMIAVIVLAAAGLTQAEKWNIDIPHSSINFNVRHMVVSKTHGQFNEFDGSIEFDGENIEMGSVEMVVQAASIDTKNEDRDKHLKSADFFNAKEYPAMTFRSTKIVKGEGNNFQLIGYLTIKDVTREVTFDCEFNGIVVDPMSNTRAGFSATTVINRQDFNIKWSKNLDTGGLVVGDDVKITIEIEAVKAKR